MSLIPGPLQIRARELLAKWDQEGRILRSPTLWRYEATTTLTKAVCFGSVTSSEVRVLLALLQSLEIESVPPDNEQMARALAWTERLRRVAAYDSFYLALAETLGCELWTADRHLANAVGVPWVHCITEQAGKAG